jgi:hypothetical protein
MFDLKCLCFVFGFFLVGVDSLKSGIVNPIDLADSKTFKLAQNDDGKNFILVE